MMMKSALKERIDKLTENAMVRSHAISSHFDSMQPGSIHKLTDGFKEPYVRYIMDRVKPVIATQKELMAIFLQKHRQWEEESNPWFIELTYSAPQYMYDMQFDLDCQKLITCDKPSGKMEPTSNDDADSVSAEHQEQTTDHPSDHGQQLSEAQAKIRELEETVGELSSRQKGLSREQAVLFGHALATYCQFTFTNKKTELAPMISRLFGWGEASVQKRLCEGYSSADRQAVAEIFEQLCPDFANHVRSFDK